MLPRVSDLESKMYQQLHGLLSQSEREIVPFREWLPIVTPEFTWDWKHLLFLQNALDLVARRELLKLMIWLPPRHGKQIADSTPILTTKGWTTHGGLKVGDFVYHPSGKPVRIIAISEKTVATKRVRFSNGESIKCHENHEWALYRKGRGYQTRETKWLQDHEIGDRNRSYYNRIDNHNPLLFEGKSLSVPPYVLGAWLGDGSTGKPTITHAENETEVIAKVTELGYNKSASWVHPKTGVKSTNFGYTGLTQQLQEIGVFHEKHIPEIYKFSSIDQRKELIAGLIDTDGYVEPDSGRVRIVTASKRLAADIIDVLKSLAQMPSDFIQQPKTTPNSSSIIGTKPVHYISFQPTMTFPTAIPRKKIHRIVKQRRISMVAIEDLPIGEQEQGHCIQVDSEDGLYLVGDQLIATHNSEMTTIRFPAWWLERNPEQKVIVAAYNQTLANKFSRQIRKIARERIPISSERKAADEWETDAGGGCRAIGVGGGITGMGGNLIVIDDPVKSRAEANSVTYRNRLYEWYRDDLWTRRQTADTPIVVIQTRWHEDDLSGRLLEMEDDWTVINLPALAEDNDPLGRQIGEALCPERFDRESLLQTKKFMGRSFDALYQQRPVEQEGGYFKKSWFVTIESLPEGNYDYCRFWDKAATEDGDYTAGVLLAINRDSKYVYVIDVVRGQWSPHHRDAVILQTAKNDKAAYGNVKIRHEQEPGSSGIDAARQTNTLLHGYSVKAIRSTGSKIVRAEPFQAQCEGGNVFLVKGSWNFEYLEELTSFPQGKHDDQVDASASAYAELSRGNAFIIRPKGIR